MGEREGPGRELEARQEKPECTVYIHELVEEICLPKVKYVTEKYNNMYIRGKEERVGEGRGMAMKGRDGNPRHHQRSATSL